MAVATSTALTVLSLAATAASTGVAVYGQRQAAKSAEATNAYNAALAKDQALTREREDHEQTMRARADKRRRMAMARSKIAASGAALGEGTSADIMEVLDTRLELGIQDASRRAQLEARAIRQQQKMADLDTKRQVSALKTQSYGTLLSGGSQLAGDMSNFSYKGGF